MIRAAPSQHAATARCRGGVHGYLLLILILRSLLCCGKRSLPLLQGFVFLNSGDLRKPWKFTLALSEIQKPRVTLGGITLVVGFSRFPSNM